MVESLEVKTTKSILLRSIIEKCKQAKDYSTIKEGDLIKCDDICLQIQDEDNLRGMLMLRRDALKGLRVEGMDVNNLVSSILQDYSYILIGENDSCKEKLLIKIPMEIGSEFENKYSIDDLLIGKVSIIGVYKGRVTLDDINSNTFNYFSARGTSTPIAPVEESKIFASNDSVSDGVVVSIHHHSPPKYIDEFHFIDVISIIQGISFNSMEIPVLRLNFIMKILMNLRKWFGSRRVRH